MTWLLFLAVWILAIVFIVLFIYGAKNKNCSGTCEQGRKPCDCDNGKQ